MLPPECHCYLINLDRSPERLASMQAHLSALGIAHERVPGVDGLALDEVSFRGYTRENHYYKPLTRGEVGCYLSHQKALQCFLASTARYGLVLEDDVRCAMDIGAVLSTAIGLLETTQHPLLQWDLLKLTQRRRNARYIELAPLKTRHLVEYGLSVPTLANATLWSRAGAERWVNAFRGCTRPIDCDLQHPWEYGLNILSVHPSVATQVDMVSTIGQRKGNRYRNPWPKLYYEVKRIWPRLRHFSRRYGWRMLLAWIWQPQQKLHPHQK